MRLWDEMPQEAIQETNRVIDRYYRKLVQERPKLAIPVDLQRVHTQYGLRFCHRHTVNLDSLPPLLSRPVVEGLHEAMRPLTEFASPTAYRCRECDARYTFVTLSASALRKEAERVLLASALAKMDRNVILDILATTIAEAMRYAYDHPYPPEVGEGDEVDVGSGDDGWEEGEEKRDEYSPPSIEIEQLGSIEEKVNAYLLRWDLTLRKYRPHFPFPPHIYANLEANGLRFCSAHEYWQGKLKARYLTPVGTFDRRIRPIEEFPIKTKRCKGCDSLYMSCDAIVTAIKAGLTRQGFRPQRRDRFIRWMAEQALMRAIEQEWLRGEEDND